MDEKKQLDKFVRVRDENLREHRERAAHYVKKYGAGASYDKLIKNSEARKK